MTKKTGWIGVDFDGTLATYGKWKGHDHAGEPIAPMVERVKRWLADGYEVRVMTAGMSNRDSEESSLVALYIGDWTEKNIGVRLEATCTKDCDMIELWDDRAVSVEMNTGRQLTPSTRGLDAERMTFVDQTTFGFPGGNCFSACLATLLGLPLDAVPYLMGGEDWFADVRTWLAGHGFYPLMLKASDEWAPDGWNIIGGHSPRHPDDPDKQHCVVGFGRRIVHDPHPSRDGLLSYADHMLLIPTHPRGMEVRA